jgi:hypothetical protein
MVAPPEGSEFNLQIGLTVNRKLKLELSTRI